MFQLDENYHRKRLVAQVIKNISIAPPTNTWVYQQTFNLQHIVFYSYENFATIGA